MRKLLRRRMPTRSAAPDSLRKMNSQALLSSAVALRTLAQAAPWFPGMGGPSSTELVDEFGLGAVSFARSVPDAWRPYYIRELQSALRDMQRVFPRSVVRGAARALRHRSASATRRSLCTIRERERFSCRSSTSGGTLAHELSHDLDWQAVSANVRRRRRLQHGPRRARADAVRSRARCAVSPKRALFRTFSGAGSRYRPSIVPPSCSRAAPIGSSRRRWRQQGRMNGFLSAIRTAARRLRGGRAGGDRVGRRTHRSCRRSTQMTYVPDSIRVAFESHVVRSALDRPVAARAARARDAGVVARVVAVQRVGRLRCCRRCTAQLCMSRRLAGAASS